MTEVLFTAVALASMIFALWIYTYTQTKIKALWEPSTGSSLVFLGCIAVIVGILVSWIFT